MNAISPPVSADPARQSALLAMVALAAMIVVALAAVIANLALRLLAPEPTAPALARAAVLAVPPPSVRVAAAAPVAAGAGADGALASPAAGTTGTTLLPPPPTMAATMTSAAVVPARAFTLAGIGATDRARALECLATAVYYEAASEPDEGQRAVAQVVLNRVRHPAFPGTVCGVVFQGSERAGCQFSFACDGAMARAPSASGWARAARNAAAVLTGQVYAPVGLATHYHTYAVTPAWNRTLVMTDAVGAHFFHRWKGYWGTAAAFARHYRGGEPMPGPHARIEAAAPQVATAMPPADEAVSVAGAEVPPAPAAPAAARATRAPTPVAQVQPAHADSGQPLEAGGSQILDKWKDSGRPLR